MGVKGRRKRELEGEPTLLKDVQSIIDNAIEKGFVKDYEVDIEQIVQDAGILLEKDIDMDSSQSGSLSMDKKMGKWVIKVNGKHHIKRQRFTIAHEFAHYCLHRDDQGTFVDEEIYFRKDHESSIEYNADVFASELLLPKSLFEKAINEDRIKKIKDLSDKFNVSTMAITIRAEKLGFKTKSNEK